MDGGDMPSAGPADPIIDLIEDYGGVDVIDDFLTHMISLSDVVKNDMRHTLDWDDDTVHSKLWGIIKAGLDRNGRYRNRPLESAGDRGRKFSISYIDSQCLLTEWLSIYRAIRAYLHMSKKKAAA